MDRRLADAWRARGFAWSLCLMVAAFGVALILQTSAELYYSSGSLVNGGGGTVGVIPATSAGDIPATRKLHLK